MLGHEEALAAYMRSSDYPRLVAALETVTGSRWCAEDLVQDALVRVLAASRRETAVVSFAGLVRVTALNLAKNRWRSLARERSASARYGTEGLLGGLEYSSDPEVLDLRKALAVLPSREREAVALFYQLDLGVAEVAVLMDVGAGTVKTLLHRARLHLSQVLRPEVKRD